MPVVDNELNCFKRTIIANSVRGVMLAVGKHAVKKLSKTFLNHMTHGAACSRARYE